MLKLQSELQTLCDVRRHLKEQSVSLKLVKYSLFLHEDVNSEETFCECCDSVSTEIFLCQTALYLTSLRSYMFVIYLYFSRCLSTSLRQSFTSRVFMFLEQKPDFDGG